MIYIKKNAESRALIQYRSTPGADYNGLPTDVKQQIREKLLNEQGHLCAYCMRRISMGNVQIEHYHPRHPNGMHHDTDLLYTNMLGVCPGNKGNPKKEQTCDAHRGNETLTVNPLDENTIQAIQYKDNGVIFSNHLQINTDLCKTLNLNMSLIADGRKKALDNLKKKLIKHKNDGSWKTLAVSYRKKLITDFPKNEYVGILIWYLDKKVKQKI